MFSLNAKELENLEKLVDYKVALNLIASNIMQVNQTLKSGQTGNIPKEQFEKALTDLKSRQEQVERDLKIIRAELQTGEGA